MNQDLIEVCRSFVGRIYEESDEKSLFYHNWRHTCHVYRSALEIADHTDQVTESDKEILALATLFHDVSHMHGSKEHEKDSAKMAAQFLESQSYNLDKIAVIKRLIMATKLGHKPTDLLEEIMQDSDFAHFGSQDYIDTFYSDLYQEIRDKHDPEMTKDTWARLSGNFIRDHQFYTNYAKKTYNPIKTENLDKIDLIEKEEIKKMKDSLLAMKTKKKVKKKEVSKKVKNNIPEKGIETMFRAALRNHMSLSQIADNKANTLISVNGIIISIVLSSLFPKMDNNPFLVYPGLSLITFSIITIIIAILSTIPKATVGAISREEIREKKGNLIFFGNFYKMSLEDYEWGISELMQDKDYLYKSLTRDLYFLGKVLNRKYNLLRWSYYLFVTGLILTITLFAFSSNGILSLAR